MVFERATEYPTTEEHIADTPIPRSAYGFSKLTGEVYCAPRTTSTACPYTICRPFNAYGPGEMPDDEPGIAHMVPDLIRKCLSLPRGAPLPIFGDGDADAHAHAHRRHRRRDRHRDGARRRASTRTSTSRPSDELHRRRDRARSSGRRAGDDPDEFALEHLPSFEVDVVRRWPSVEKARRLLGWEARIGVHEGIAQTVAWLREAMPQTA